MCLKVGKGGSMKQVPRHDGARAAGKGLRRSVSGMRK